MRRHCALTLTATAFAVLTVASIHLDNGVIDATPGAGLASNAQIVATGPQCGDLQPLAPARSEAVSPGSVSGESDGEDPESNGSQGPLWGPRSLRAYTIPVGTMLGAPRCPWTGRRADRLLLAPKASPPA